VYGGLPKKLKAFFERQKNCLGGSHIKKVSKFTNLEFEKKKKLKYLKFCNLKKNGSLKDIFFFQLRVELKQNILKS